MKNYKHHQRNRALAVYDGKPRERLTTHGSESLSDLDIVAILLGTGSKETPVHRLALKLLDIIDEKKEALQSSDLTGLNGIGEAKASVLLAALELGRRMEYTTKRQIAFPSDIYPLVRHYADRQQEHFLRVSLNGAHEVLSIGVVSIGLVNRTIVHPREVFATPIRERATSIIVAHNHPSRNLTPSREDREVTIRLVEAGKILGIHLLDHLIFSDEEYYSFLEQGEME